MDLGVRDCLRAALFDWVKRTDLRVHFLWKIGSVEIFYKFETPRYVVVDFAPEHRAMHRVITSDSEPALDLASVLQILRPPNWTNLC